MPHISPTVLVNHLSHKLRWTSVHGNKTGRTTPPLFGNRPSHSVRTNRYAGHQSTATKITTAHTNRPQDSHKTHRYPATYTPNRPQDSNKITGCSGILIPTHKTTHKTPRVQQDQPPPHASYRYQFPRHATATRRRASRRQPTTDRYRLPSRNRQPTTTPDA